MKRYQQVQQQIFLKSQRLQQQQQQRSGLMQPYNLFALKYTILT